MEIPFLRRRLCYAIVAGFLFTSALMAAPGNAFLKIKATAPGYPEPVSVRAIIQKSDGTFVPGEWGNSDWPAVIIRGKAVTPESVIEVPPGLTSLTIGKGPDYLPQTITTNLAEAGRTYVIPITLEPAFNLRELGWVAGDAHVHYFHGDDQISRAPEEAYGIIAAGGLNFASFAEEHFAAPNLARQDSYRLWRPYSTPETKLWLGVEAPKSAWGHHASIVYDPWKIRDALPYSWGIHEVHEQGGVSYPVHPERMFPAREFEGDFGLYPWNNHFKFFPISALTGHLLDGWSSVSDEPAGNLTLTSYKTLLSLGYKIPLLADSDFCMDRINNGLKAAGFWMNYVQLGDQPLAQASVCTAIREGHVMCTTGPLVLFTIDDAISGAVLPADGRARKLRIQASYRFNPWTLSYSNFDGTAACSISQIDLLKNGEVFRSWAPGTPTALIEEPISETVDGTSYMVRVLGNEGIWMAGYASPIYFENTPRPRQPEVFKPVINGRLYDAQTGLALTGSVSCLRYGKTEWTIQTDRNGRFRVRAPIDAELVAQDGTGRELRRNLLNYEPAYAFCHDLPENYSDKGPAVDDFRELISEMEWEFPMGWQNASSYVRATLDGDAIYRKAAVVEAPAPIPGKTNSEIVLLIIDKTQVKPGDKVNYAAIFRQPSGKAPNEELSVAWGIWDPEAPRLYSKFGLLVSFDGDPARLEDLGGGFYMRQGTFVVPAGIDNANSTTGALRMFAQVRKGDFLEEACLTLRLGKTKRELLVSATWDGFPGSWSELGLGPCNFFREHTFQVRYPDYRNIFVKLRLNGRSLNIHPLADTRHVADADDAIFEDRFYYDGQCAPDYRNVPFRDMVRTQPPAIEFSELPVVEPAGTPSVSVAAMEPIAGEHVSNPVRFYYFVDRAGIPGPSEVTLMIDGRAVTNTSEVPVTLELDPGVHVWQVQAWDQMGNISSSEERTFTVLDESQEEPIPVLLDASLPQKGQFALRFEATPGSNYLLEKADFLTDWRALLRTNAAGTNVIFNETSSENPASAYRVRSYR